MGKKRKKEEGHVNHERWLVSYADFITVLMIFFVVMYSISRVDTVKYAQLASSLNSALGGGGGKNIVGVDKPNPSQGTVSPITEAQKMEEAKMQTDEFLKKEELADKVETSIDDRGLVISLQDTLIFGSGSAAIEPAQKQIIAKIGEILNSMPNYVRVEGHTDNIPIKNSQFSSNWQLSVVRASNIAEVLISDGKVASNRISALGYADNRPVEDNSTPEGKAKNRRVDIVILNSKYNETEKNTGKDVIPETPKVN